MMLRSREELFTLLQPLSDGSLHEFDGRVPLLLIVNRAIFQCVHLNHTLNKNTKHSVTFKSTTTTLQRNHNAISESRLSFLFIEREIGRILQLQSKATTASRKKHLGKLLLDVALKTHETLLGLLVPFVILQAFISNGRFKLIENVVPLSGGWISSEKFSELVLQSRPTNLQSK